MINTCPLHITTGAPLSSPSATRPHGLSVLARFRYSWYFLIIRRSEQSSILSSRRMSIVSASKKSSNLFIVLSCLFCYFAYYFLLFFCSYYHYTCYLSYLIFTATQERLGSECSFPLAETSVKTSETPRLPFCWPRQTSDFRFDSCRDCTALVGGLFRTISCAGLPSDFSFPRPIGYRTTPLPIVQTLRWETLTGLASANL